MEKESFALAIMDDERVQLTTAAGQTIDLGSAEQAFGIMLRFVTDAAYGGDDPS